MKEAGKIISLTVAVFLVCGVGGAWAQSAAELYREGVRSARAGQPDFAFASFNLLLAQEDDSAYRDKALFACGEYYYELPSYQDAWRMFTAYVNEFPAGREMPFALAYLFRLANEHARAGDLSDLRRQVIGDIQSRAEANELRDFKEFKELRLRSPMNREYRARYYVDRIEIIRQDERWEVITW